jgi:hypothetical protein
MNSPNCFIYVMYPNGRKIHLSKCHLIKEGPKYQVEESGLTNIGKKKLFQILSIEKA